MDTKEKSIYAVSLLKEAILEVIKQNPEGIINNEIARLLKLESDFEGNQKNYLSWSVIGLLVNEGKVRYKKIGARKLYFID